MRPVCFPSQYLKLFQISSVNNKLPLRVSTDGMPRKEPVWNKLWVIQILYDWIKKTKNTADLEIEKNFFTNKQLAQKPPGNSIGHHWEKLLLRMNEHSLKYWVGFFYTNTIDLCLHLARLVVSRTFTIALL